MAQTGIPHVDNPPDYRGQGEQIAAGATEPLPLGRVGRMLLSTAQEALVWAIEYVLKYAGKFVVFVAGTLTKGEDASDPVFRDLARTAIKDLTGQDLAAGHASIGKNLLDAITGGPGATAGDTLEPSAKGAEAYMTMVMQLALEGYLEGSIVHAVSLGYLEKFGELDDILANVLSINRITRRVVQPLLQARVITPMQWLVNKQYRPELLSAAQAAGAYFAGRYTFEELEEELARQGWSRERIAELVAGAARTLSAADAALAVRRGEWSRDDALQHLRDQGYPLETAELALKLQEARDVEQFEEQLAGAALTAYADRRIERAEFTELVHAAMFDRRAAARIVELGETRRALNRRRLSSGEARRLARARILSVPDYRRALRQEGYEELAIAALELELMTELQADRELEELRKQQAAERAAEKAEREAERLRRELELEQKRARAFQTLADARRLYVRGYVSLEAYRAELEREQLPNLEIAAYLADAEQDRADYLEALERRRQAAARDDGAVVPIAAIEASVLRGILSLADYDRELAARQFDEAEIRVLHNLLADRLEDVEAARRERAEAERRAALAGVSLGTWERAVRLGVRTRAQYAAFLEELALAAPARALILDLLDEQIRRDAEAQAAREEAEAAAASRGISLEQRARAVVRGIRPIAYYRDALAATTIPGADQLVLVELLEAEAAAAAEARARRDELADSVGDAELPLATIERAVRLGALPPAALRERALARGLAEADAELLVQLVVADIPLTRQAQHRERTIVQELAARQIAYADEKALVKRGIRSLEQHAAWIGEQGYGGADAELLVQLLEEEIAADMDGQRRRLAAKLEKAEGAPAIADFEAALRAGELDVPGFVEALTSWNVGRDEALVFGRLLVTIGESG